MADYPCDNHHARYNGPSNRVYLNIYREDESVKLKAAVCGDCLADLVSAWLSMALHATPSGSFDPPAEDLQLEDLWQPSGAASAPLGRRGRY